LNNLGVLYVREQEYAKAEEQFESCIRVNPKFDQAYLNLARLYVMQNDKEKARAVLQELLRALPESATGKQAMDVLNSLP
jgi:FimV-like protein